MTDHSRSHIDVEPIRALMPDARRGDQTAREQICRQVQDYLTYAASRNLDDRLSAKLNPSDIVQLTLTRMIQGFDNFRGETTAEFYGWLNTILHNEINSVRRDLKRECRDVRREQSFAHDAEWTAAPSKNAAQTPSGEAMLVEKIDRLHQVMLKLPADYAEVIRLRSLDELTFQQVAEQMGKTLHSVTKLWYRAIVRLQEELEQLDESIL